MILDLIVLYDEVYLQGVSIDCKGVNFGLFFRFLSTNSPLFTSKNRKNRLKTTPFRYDAYLSQPVY